MTINEYCLQRPPQISGKFSVSFCLITFLSYWETINECDLNWSKFCHLVERRCLEEYSVGTIVPKFQLWKNHLKALDQKSRLQWVLNYVLANATFDQCSVVMVAGNLVYDDKAVKIKYQFNGTKLCKAAWQRFSGVSSWHLTRAKQMACQGLRFTTIHKRECKRVKTDYVAELISKVVRQVGDSLPTEGRVNHELLYLPFATKCRLFDLVELEHESRRMEKTVSSEIEASWKPSERLFRKVLATTPEFQCVRFQRVWF